MTCPNSSGLIFFCLLWNEPEGDSAVSSIVVFMMLLLDMLPTRLKRSFNHESSTAFLYVPSSTEKSTLVSWSLRKLLETRLAIWCGGHP